MSSNDVRSAITELRQILNTPIRGYESTADEPSSDSDPSGRSSSDSDCLNDADLPGLITRVLGKRELMSPYLLILYYTRHTFEFFEAVSWHRGICSKPVPF